MRRVVLNHLNVADQPGASIGPFDQIVTQQSIAGEAAIQHAMQCVDFVNPFSYKNAFAVKVLIYIRRRMSIDIETSLSRIDACQPGARRTLNAYPDPWLQNAVARNHNSPLRVDNRLIQRVRQSSNHSSRRASWQLRIGIERDDETNTGKNR